MLLEFENVRNFTHSTGQSVHKSGALVVLLFFTIILQSRQKIVIIAI